MTNAKRDQNNVTTILGVSSVDGVTPTPLQVNPVTGRVKAEVSGNTDINVKISSADTTTDFLENKITAGTGITLTKLNVGGDEEIEISSPGGSSLPVVDTTEIVKGSVDDTKKVRFEVDGLTTATTRVLTVQDKDGTIATTGDNVSQFTNDAGYATGGGTASGTNTGDQTITLTGDVTGSGTGSFAATIAPDSVTYDKMQDVSATDKLLGRSTAGAGTVEEITCTAAGRALLDDVDAAAQRTTLNVDVAGTDNSTDVTLAGSLDYLTISGQEITRNAIDLTTDVTGTLPIANGGTGASTLSGASIVTYTGTETLTNKTLTDPKITYTINTQTGTTYTLALTDQSKIVEMNNASANTVTIPTNASVAFPVGTTITVVQIGAGATTINGDTGVTVNGVSAGSATLTAAYQGFALYKRATDTWVLINQVTA